MVRRYRVALVASSHLHKARDFRHEGTRYVWSPASSFLSRLAWADQQIAVLNLSGRMICNARENPMAGKSPIVADAVRRQALVELSRSHDRGEADRARAMLLTLAGWTSRRIAEAFGVREDTVRLWRSLFMTNGVAALRRRVAPGPAPVKATCALAVAHALLDTPVADRPNWTLPRLAEEIEQRAGVRISPSRLSVVLRKKGALAGGGRGTR
jgi:transposase